MPLNPTPAPVAPTSAPDDVSRQEPWHRRPTLRVDLDSSPRWQQFQEQTKDLPWIARIGTSQMGRLARIAEGLANQPHRALRYLGMAGTDDQDVTAASAPVTSEQPAPPRAFADVVGGPPQGYSGRDPLEVLAGIDDKFAMKAAGLEETFNKQREELGELFEFAETPEEKARIAFVLGDIEEQRTAGQQVIAREYAEAVQQGRAQAAAMRDAAATEGQAMGDIFRQGADRGREHLASAQQLYADANLGVGAQPVSEDAADFVGVMEAAAPREEALARTLGNIAADDVGFLGETMAAEGGAQQGALMRAALGLRAHAINRHQAALADRQARERAAYRDAVLGMQRDFTNRQFDLEDRGHQGRMRMADILEGRRATADDRRFQYEQDARDFALDQWALEQQQGSGGPPIADEDPFTWAMFLTSEQGGWFMDAAEDGKFGENAKAATDLVSLRR